MSDIFLKEKFADWKVDTDTFEGPLDLLLYLIKKHDLDIYDIPIAEITSEYLKYLELLKELNLNNVGDFLVMASVLMRIKSKTLLPSEETPEEGEEDVEQLRQDLINRLVEYKKYKDSLDYFRTREKMYENVIPLRPYPVHEVGYTLDATLFDLVDAFQKMLENARQDIKDIITEEFTVEDKIRYIMNLLEKKNELKLSELVDENTIWLEIIVFILAILELIRTHQVMVKQKRSFGEIYLQVIYEQQ